MGIAMGAVGAGIGITQTIMGAVQAKDAREALENYERQQLENVAENLTVSTMGADLQREESARLGSTQIDALRGGGSRAIIGGSGRVEEGIQRMNREIGADLDRQQKEIDRMYAQDEANIRGMQESRENADIAGLSSQYTAGRQGMFDGMGNTLRGAAMAFGMPPKERDPQTPVNSGLNSEGLTTFPNQLPSSSAMNYSKDQYGNYILK